MKNHHIILIAGEASGDMRAAGLAQALKQLDPTLRLTGIGGQYMRQAGVECFTDITELAVIGIAEVVKNFSRIKKVFDQTLKQIDETHPDAVILVDYPGFNLRLANEIKKRSSCRTLAGARNIKIIYYISPQVWAWREKRVLKIKELVDRMIVLFPFEQEIYRKYGMKVDYVGHPLVDEIIVDHDQTEVLKSIGFSASKTTIGIMPGSRAKEIERHLPCMLQAAQILFKQNRERQFILLKASSIPLKTITSVIESTNRIIESNNRVIASGAKQSFKHLPIKIYDGPTYDGINAMDAAMVASGTATLETALLKKPMVVIYKTSWLTYAIARAVIKIPYIGLVNIVAGKKIAEELIQNEASPANIANALESALHNPQIIEELSKVKILLGDSGASQRAAQVVLSVISPLKTR
jgi:lipid-A-disaccharide synthase